MIVSFLQRHPLVQTGQIDPDENLGVMLIEFFELYGLCFNYNQVGISVVRGGSYITRQNSNNSPRALSLMTIDPNNPTNNTGKSASKISSVRQLFEQSFKILTEELGCRHEQLFTGSMLSMAEHKAGPQASLIRSILSVPYTTLKHRQHVHKVFYKGDLQRMLSQGPVEQVVTAGIPGIAKPRVKSKELTDQSGQHWLATEVSKLRAMYMVGSGDHPDMDEILRSKQELIVMQSKYVIETIEANRGKPLSDAERGEVFDEASRLVKTQLGFKDDVELALMLSERRTQAGPAQAVVGQSGAHDQMPEHEIIYVHADDSDEEEDALESKEDSFFDGLMRQAEAEYGESDADEENRAIAIEDDSEEETKPDGDGRGPGQTSDREAGHRNPDNVHVSHDSILLPQLALGQDENSAWDDEMEAVLRRARGLDD